MTLDIALVIALVVAAMVVFTAEWLPVDLTTLLVVSALVFAGILSPSEAFAGFASEVIIILASIFILSAALVRTGVMESVAHTLERLAGRSESRIVAILMTLAASLSAFINNTNTTAVLMPATLDLAKRWETPPSRVLMPLAFASILGGTCTVIGTSTNVAASGLLSQLGYEPYSLFEFTAVGVVIVMAGVLYFSTLGHRWLPKLAPVELGARFDVEDYLSTMVLPDDSGFIGRTLEDVPLSEMGLAVLEIVRGTRRILPRPSRALRAGDHLIVHGDRDALVRAKESPDVKFEAEIFPKETDRVAGDIRLIEAIVMPSSSLDGGTLRGLRFRQRFGASVLAVYRRGRTLVSDLRDVPLRSGDVLLLQGRPEHLAILQGRRDMWLLGEVVHVAFRGLKGTISVAALGLAVILSTAGVLPLSLALLSAAIVVVMTRCLPAQQVYELIEFRLLILIGGMTAVGAAMVKTGAAEWLAGQIVALALPWGVTAVLAVLAILTILLTQPLSNAAAVLVILPVALATATQLGVNPRTFAVMVTMAASISLITPFEPASLLVYGPGGYRFRHFLQHGSVLTAIAVGILLVLVPRLWPIGP